MILYSTNNRNVQVSFKEAVLKGLADDRGLFFPQQIDKMPTEFFDNLPNLTLQEMSYLVAKNFIGDEIPDNVLKSIVYETLNFDIPTVEIVKDKIYTLELFHGPTCAFKDVGARFMARCFNYFLAKNQKVTILVATSGDTGSAVANGFLGIKNIDVIVLYPKGKVSEIQEKQFTTLGKNITSICIDGTFDDCQTLVKSAFVDKELKGKINLSSANSINIARLLPQSFYYFYTYSKLVKYNKKINICVPSGNFGNITAGLFAKAMGLPINKFLAATNSNRVFLDYVETGKYSPRSSVQTVANAMDVGDPSNFVRIQNFYDNSLSDIKTNIITSSYSDSQINKAMARVLDEYDYLLDPHGATGFLATEEYLKKNTNELGVFLETAHPAKFKEIVKNAIGKEVAVPQKLKEFINRESKSIMMSKEYNEFKQFLLKK